MSSITILDKNTKTKNTSFSYEKNTNEIKEIANIVKAYKGAGFRNATIVGETKLVASTYLQVLINNYYIQNLIVNNSFALNDISQEKNTLEFMDEPRTIRRAVESGELSNGVLASCIKNGTKFSILADTKDKKNELLEEAITEPSLVQKVLSKFCYGVDLLLILGVSEVSLEARKFTSLNTKVIVVDLDFNVVKQLCLGKYDVGIITDLGLFLRFLTEYIYS